MNSRALAWIGVVVMPIGVIGALALASRNVGVRNGEMPTQMMTTPALRAFDARDARGGIAMRLPVPGTMARGGQSFAFDTSQADAARAGRELANPLTPSRADLMRAKTIFTNQCAVCHGASGLGDGPIIPKYPNPPSFRTPASRELPDGTLFHVITVGRNNMPAQASRVSYDDRWRLVHYIRALQREG